MMPPPRPADSASTTAPKMSRPQRAAIRPPDSAKTVTPTSSAISLILTLLSGVVSADDMWSGRSAHQPPTAAVRGLP